jgi:hypothetical protein
MKQSKIILRHMSHMCHRTVAIFVHQFPTEKINDRHLRRTLEVSKPISSIEQNMYFEKGQYYLVFNRSRTESNDKFTFPENPS